MTYCVFKKAKLMKQTVSQILSQDTQRISITEKVSDPLVTLLLVLNMN